MFASLRLHRIAAGTAGPLCGPDVNRTPRPRHSPLPLAGAGWEEGTITVPGDRFSPFRVLCSAMTVA
ncbi:hypothetical protein TVNIR_1640 [Thioalkalivibrio nitratireducens DSM 14787]|uniref:Uncharacterized protein n=1 Tax=Thioalkalivibrio nitratireducens (strain DSM 14787 / UNIQEM 213 / ALEN2) TaxID=1255043 RepID=L0DWB1_THIND|nr:hypothetical protein TVNIR_1640 [Thioalkalivibrio nitratireducens DSM 14787]